MELLGASVDLIASALLRITDPALKWLSKLRSLDFEVLH
jgi:hypothetical protein